MPRVPGAAALAGRFPLSEVRRDARRGRWAALFQCAACGRQTSVTAGTIFQDTRTPLPTWFRAMWWVTSQKTGASAVGLQRVLGLGSYETAWTWLHKLRRAMVRPGRDRLTGRVEVDETYIGGVEEGVRGPADREQGLDCRGGRGGRRGDRTHSHAPDSRCHGRQPPGVHPGGGGAGQRAAHRRAAQLRPAGEARLSAPHHVLKGRKESASELLPRVHRVVSLLKRWLLGTHQGAVSRAHLDYYLDEFTFRFNRRTSRHRGKLFYRLVQQAVAVDPAPYASLVKHVRPGTRRRRHHKI